MHTMLSSLKSFSQSVARRLASLHTPSSVTAAQPARTALLESLEARQMLSGSSGITMDSLTLRTSSGMADVTVTDPNTSKSYTAPTVTNSSYVEIVAHGVVGSEDSLATVIFFLDTNHNGIIDKADRPLIGARRLPGASDFLARLAPGKLPLVNSTDNLYDEILVRAVDKKGRYSAVTADDSHTIRLNVVAGPAIDTLVGPAYINTLDQKFNLVASGVRDYASTIQSVTFYQDLNSDGIADPGEAIETITRAGQKTYQLSTKKSVLLATAPALPQAVQFLAVATDALGHTSPAVKFSTGPKIDGLYTDKSLTITRDPSLKLNLVTPLALSAGAKGKGVELYIDSNHNGVIDAGDTLIKDTSIPDTSRNASGYWRTIGGYIIRLDDTAFASIPTATNPGPIKETKVTLLARFKATRTNPAAGISADVYSLTSSLTITLVEPTALP